MRSLKRLGLRTINIFNFVVESRFLKRHEGRAVPLLGALTSGVTGWAMADPIFRWAGHNGFDLPKFLCSDFFFRPTAYRFHAHGNIRIRRPTTTIMQPCFLRKACIPT